MEFERRVCRGLSVLSTQELQIGVLFQAIGSFSFREITIKIPTIMAS